jgi:Flp pilus assembly protein TadG
MQKKQAGAAIVEFTLMLPLLLLLMFITAEFGRAMYQYGALTKSVREAVRYLSIQTPGTHATEAGNLIVYGNLAGTGTPLVLGLTLAHVATPTWQTAGSNPVISTVTLQVTGYTFNSLVPSVFGMPFGNIAFPPVSATMRSHL